MRIPVVDLNRTGQKHVKELQELLGFATPQAIYKWQHGDSLPTVDNLVALSVIFDVPIDNILAVSESQT